MNKEGLWLFFRSVVITCLVAYLIAFAITGKAFPVGWFLILFLSQFILFQIVGLIAEQFLVARTIRQVSAEQTAIIENTVGRQSLALDCAYCNMTNQNVPVLLNQENTFKCFSCNQESAIYMQFYAARRTQPLETPALSAK